MRLSRQHEAERKPEVSIYEILYSPDSANAAGYTHRVYGLTLFKKTNILREAAKKLGVAEEEAPGAVTKVFEKWKAKRKVR